jgi:hypothetical protein
MALFIIFVNMRLYLICFLLLFSFLSGFAQRDSANLVSSATHRCRISLITCGMGNEEWQTFGHTTLRVIDSDKTGIHRDIVYNYGTFDGFDGNFEWQFFTGTMTYYVDVVCFNNFIQEYVHTGRGMIEQVLLLTGDQKKYLVSRLEKNALLKNREYQYDVFYNNCCTKVRDLIADTYGPGFLFGPAFPPNMNVSLRTAYNEYYRERPWERTGLNIVIGSPADTIISKYSIMFIPDFLSKCCAGATYKGQKVFADPIRILRDHISEPEVVDEPFIVTCMILLFTLLALQNQKLYPTGLANGGRPIKLRRIMAILVLLISGVFGCLIIFFWFFSNHGCARYNFNILWAFPINLVLPFLNVKWKAKYALSGMIGILISMLLHVLKIQVMPLFELGPYLLALLLVYGAIYRDSRAAKL